MTVELMFLGKTLDVYRGMDGTKPLHLKAGDGIGVSETKAEKLLADYPDDFARVEGAKELDMKELKEDPKPEPPTKRELKEPTPLETTLERSKRTAKANGKEPKKNKAFVPKRNKSFVPLNKRK
jgi:hypothetical protein